MTFFGQCIDYQTQFDTASTSRFTKTVTGTYTPVLTDLNWFITGASEYVLPDTLPTGWGCYLNGDFTLSGTVENQNCDSDVSVYTGAIVFKSNGTWLVWSTTGTNTDYTVGLLAYWAFEDTGWKDESLNGNTLTPINAPTIVAGIVNNAVDFDEATSQYLNITSSDFDFSNTDFSIGWYFNLNSGYVGTRHNMIDHSSANPNLGLVVLINHNVGGIIRVTTSASGTSQTLNDTTFVPAEDTWHYMAITYDLSASLLTVYFNDETPQTFTHSGGIYYNATPFDISGDSLFFNGQIDEMSVYNTVIGQAQYNFLKSGVTMVAGEFV